MSLSSLRYVCKETMLSLRRNAWMSLASVATVAISLIILGFAITLVYNTNQLASNVESDIEISVFLKELNNNQIQDIQTRIEGMEEVSGVELVSKDQALKQFQASLSTELLDNLGGVNPLPDKFTVKVTKPETVKIVAEKISALQGVDKVNYGQGIVEKILKFTQWVRFVGSTVIGLLAVASIVLISITIRLTVFARRREIQ
ncbi:MAG TPA: permease-like cell division protein FtsX, partial [Verrucomicrobiae bacterium]|nr:permease-like cell division protein FtsX [Verrucomicrobiae bacterium]